MQHESQQYLIVVPVGKILGEKLPLCLLCTIIYKSPDEVVLPQNRHLCEKKPLSNTDDSLNLLVVNDVMHAIDSAYNDK